MTMPPLPPGPSGRSNVFGLAAAGGGGPVDVVVDVDDVVPSPGDDVTVACQVVDRAGNGTPVAGRAITLTLTGSHASLASVDLFSDADGRATTTLHVAADCPDGTRLRVDGALG